MIETTARWPLEALLKSALATTLLGAVMLVGAVHVTSMLLVGLGGTLCLVLALLVEQGRRTPGGRVLPAILLWALATVCVVQLLPLPMSILKVVAPTNADIWARSLLPTGEPSPTWAPVSLDPAATAVETLRWFSYGALTYATATVARREGTAWGAALVFVVGVGGALVTLVHGLAGAHKVFGIYSPTLPPRTWVIGPLLNTNNLAGLLNLAALCGFGILVAERSPFPRWFLGLGAAALVGVNVAAGSRAGVALLVLGLIAMGIVVELMRGRRGVSEKVLRRSRQLAVATLALGSLLAALGGTKESWAGLRDENLEKLSIIATVERAFGDFMWLGMGRGSFESVFPAYQSAHGDIVYTHVENFVAQWIVEWGAPISLVAFLAFGYALSPGRVGASKSVTAMAVWLGVVVVLAQNMVDLGMEVPGLVAPTSIAIGAIWGGTRSLREEGVRRPARSLSRALVGVTTGIVLVGSIGVFFRYDVASDRRAIRTAVLSSEKPRPAGLKSALRERIVELMRRHPAEPYFPLIGGLLAFEEQDQDPLPWLQRSLERSLVNGKAHLLVAHILLRHGLAGQARLELRLAVEADGTLVNAAARAAHRAATSATGLAEVVPDNANAGKIWMALARHAPDRVVGAACDEQALLADPTLKEARWRLVQDIVRAERDDGACDDARSGDCAEALEVHARAFDTHAPKTSMAIQTRAYKRSVAGEAREAEAWLAAECEVAADAAACQRVRADLASELDDPERFADASKALLVAVCTDRSRCAQTATWIGDTHLRRDELGAAIKSFERAVRDEETDARLLRLADAAERAGLHAQAQRALERVLARRGGKDPTIEARLKRVRQQLMRGILKP